MFPTQRHWRNVNWRCTHPSRQGWPQYLTVWAGSWLCAHSKTWHSFQFLKCLRIKSRKSCSQFPNGYRMITWASNSTPRYIPKWKENRDWNRFLHTCSQQPKWRNNPTPIHRGMDPENVASTFNGILLSLQKGWCSDIRYNMNELFVFFLNFIFYIGV